MEWFLYKAGQVEGPISQLELLTKINTGEINDDELMCRKGDEQWKTLKDFRSQLFVEKSPDEAPVIRDWILLIENLSVENGDVKQGQFVQNGPFTAEEVKELIQSGKAKYSDYIWKTGFSQWARINEVDEFFGKVSSNKEVPQVEFDEKELVAEAASELDPVDENQDLLENVLKQVHTGKHLDFVENFPEAIEPVAEPRATLEPLFAEKSPVNEPAFTFETESVEPVTAPTPELPPLAPASEASVPEKVESFSFLTPIESEPSVRPSAFALAETDFEPPTPRKVDIAKWKMDWSFKKHLDIAAQGQLLPWLMLSLSLAVTGLFAVWYFTQEPEMAPSASINSEPATQKNPENQKPSLNPKKDRSQREAPTAAREPVESLTPRSQINAPRSAKANTAKSTSRKMAQKPVNKKIAKTAVTKAKAAPEIARVAQQFQKKAEALDRQYANLKDRPFEWKRFYTNWKSELLNMDDQTDLSEHHGTALLRKLSFGKRRLVQRATMMDQSIVNERAVSSDFEEENVPQIFRDISSQARSKK
jgi:hypothetical protein